MNNDEERELELLLASMRVGLDRMLPGLQAILVQHEQEMQEAIKEHGPRNGWIKKAAVEIFEQDGLECWIVKDQELWDIYDRRHEEKPELYAANSCGYNGYVVFKEKPVVEPGYRGILTYVPVHGGITYAHHDELGSVYGFDTNHYDSRKFPIRDIDWMKGEIDVMARGILYASSIEDAYLKADGNNLLRADLVQPILDLRPTGPNFGTMLNLIGGEL